MKNVTVEGLPKILNKLSEIDRKLRKKIVRDALRKAAKIIRTKSQSEVSVVTGKTRKGIKLGSMKRKKDRIGIKVFISAKSFTKGFYATFPELGTKNMERQRPMGEAFDATQKQAEEIVRNEIWAGIKAAI